MFKINFAGSKFKSVVLDLRKVAFVLATAVLLSIACTTVVDVTPTPVQEAQSQLNESAGPTDTPSPASKDSTSVPTREPTGGTPQPETGTPEPNTGRRPLPNSGELTVQRIPDTPVPTQAQVLPANTLGLVLAVSGGSSSSTIKTLVTTPGTNEVTGTAFINLESSSKSVVLFRPDTGDATVIDSYSSPSYAPHFKRPYTVDDRFYVSNKFTDGGAMTITEYGTDGFNRKSEWGTQTDALDPGYAVAGGEVYFKTGSTEQWSMSRGITFARCSTLGQTPLK